MYNKSGVIAAKKKLGLYFLDLIHKKTKPLGVRELRQKYHITPKAINWNLDFSYFYRKDNKKICYLSKRRKKQINNFLKKISKELLSSEDNKLDEILFYTFFDIEKKW